MPGLSIHVVDVSRGLPAVGMRVQVSANDGNATLGDARVGAAGAVLLPQLAERVLAEGRYVASFYVADWYRGEGVALSVPPFLDVIRFDFAIADRTQHYHLPLKVTPWGYSLFRGGA